jgi:hypothetical protein
MRWISIILAGLMAASAAAAPALAAAPYEGDWIQPYTGKWGPEAFYCDFRSSAGATRITLREDSMSFGEIRYCQFTRIQRKGSTFTIDMACSAEGEDRHKDRMILEMLGPGRLSVWKKSLGKQPAQTLVRCPERGDNAARMMKLWETTEAACRATGEEEACEQMQFLHLWLSGLVGNAACFKKKGEPEALHRWHKCTERSIRPDSVD